MPMNKIKIIKKLLSILKYSNVKNMSYDDPEITPFMNYNIKNHSFVRKVYEEFYRIFVSSVSNMPEGKRVELGAGYGFFKDFAGKSILRSDICSSHNIDIKFSAEQIPFKDESVTAYFMLGVLHHIKNPENLFNEVVRTLKKGGKFVLIEPNVNLWAKLMYKISHSEPFNSEAGWRIEGNRPLTDANLALPWIMFVRDRKMFELKFPNLHVSIKLHNPITFQISGAGAFRTFLPGFSYPIFKSIEILLTPFYKYVAMWMTIEIEKTGSRR